MRSMMLVMGLAVVVSGLAFAAEETKSYGLCPVSGGPAKEDVSTDFKGKKLYFCCDGCPDAVKSDPAKFAAKINHQLAVTKQIAQVGCPFSGGTVNDKTVVDFAGAKVGFCCEKCQAKFEKSSDSEKLETVFAKLAKGFTMQDKCPVSGKPISASHKTEHDGTMVYFCCGGCPDAFKADPAKFAAKLPKSE
jgi:YHS domain-containing protein